MECFLLKVMYVNSNLMFVKSFLSGFVAIVGVCYPEPIKSVDAGAGGTMPVYLFIHILIFQDPVTILTSTCRCLHA
jgi:hypothetical protein